MSDQDDVDNRLILAIAPYITFGSDGACDKILLFEPGFYRPGWRDMVPERLRALSNYNNPADTSTPFRFIASAASMDFYEVNETSVVWLHAHPEFSPDDALPDSAAKSAPQEIEQLPLRGADTDNEDCQHRALVAQFDINLINVPPGMAKNSAMVYGLDIIEMTDPDHRRQCIETDFSSTKFFQCKKLYVSARWKTALYNPLMRKSVINIFSTIDEDGSWIRALLNVLTYPSNDPCYDIREPPIGTSETPYIVVPPGVNHKRAIGYLVLLKCMKDSQSIKNKVTQFLFTWKDRKSKKLFIRTLLIISTRICRRQICRLFNDLKQNSNWRNLIHRVLARLD